VIGEGEGEGGRGEGGEGESFGGALAYGLGGQAVEGGFRGRCQYSLLKKCCCLLKLVKKI